MLITPADRAGARVGCFPARAAFPVSMAGRRPRLLFRGLLKLHSRYGLQGCSSAFQRTLSRGFEPNGYPPGPLVSYHVFRQLHGWVLPPLVVCAVGAHTEIPVASEPIMPIVLSLLLLLKEGREQRAPSVTPLLLHK